jgi:hypothetical protein
MYYGNPGCSSQQYPTRTWDSNYFAVYHMNDYSTSQINDSTSYARHGTKKAVNQPIESIYGFIQNCQNYTGGSDHYITASTISASPTGAYTLECIAKTGDTSQDKCMISQGYDEENENEFSMSIANFDAQSGENPAFKYNITFGCCRYVGTWYRIQTTDAPLLSGNWVYSCGTYDNGFMVFYKNGVLVGTNTFGEKEVSTVGNQPLGIGVFTKTNGYSEYWCDSLDEVRISNIARTQEWISTEFNNQNNPTGFLSFGPEESPP